MIFKLVLVAAKFILTMKRILLFGLLLIHFNSFSQDSLTIVSLIKLPPDRHAVFWTNSGYKLGEVDSLNNMFCYIKGYDSQRVEVAIVFTENYLDVKSITFMFDKKDSYNRFLNASKGFEETKNYSEGRLFGFQDKTHKYGILFQEKYFENKQRYFVTLFKII